MITGAWRGSSQSAQDKSTVASRCTHRLVLQGEEVQPAAERATPAGLLGRQPRAGQVDEVDAAGRHHRVPVLPLVDLLQRRLEVAHRTESVAHHFVVLSQPRQCCSMKRMTSAGRASHSTVERPRCGFHAGERNLQRSLPSRSVQHRDGDPIADVGFPFDTMTASPVGLRIGVH